MDLGLNDKTALVTGSTAGTGLEIARKLAVEGAKVVITGRNQAKLDQAVDSIRASGGDGVRAYWLTPRQGRVLLPLHGRCRAWTSLSTISGSMR
jgi:NAD(P)-dependent dehydrogenase (short-subunit alcohol dehydrogenase family)